MSKIALLHMSRNNYEVLEHVFYGLSHETVKNVPTFNMDCGSSDENREKAASFLKKTSIQNIDFTGETYPYQVCIEAAITALDDKYEWLAVTQQDVIVPHKDFWSSLEKNIDNRNFSDKIGIVGFPIQNMPNRGDICYGRGVMIDGVFDDGRDGWHLHYPKLFLEKEYFVVEVPYWVLFLINVKLFKKFIKTDPNFLLNFSGDDLSHQFAINNIASVIIPKYVITEDRWIKAKYGIRPANEGYNKFYHNDHWNHHHFWNNKYGYSMYYVGSILEQKKQRYETFLKLGNRYSGTLIEKLFNYHINEGPKSLEDFGL